MENTKLQKNDETKIQNEVKEEYFLPSVDIIENEKEFLLFADLPGCDEKSLDINLEKNTLTIKAIKNEIVKDDFDLVYCEYTPGNYKRSFALSDDIDRENVKANIKDGILRLILPKSKDSQPKKITVAVA
jgi:HSP20 family molecular chaperone IbpA